MEEPRGFEKARIQAEKLAEEQEKIQQKLTEALEKAKAHQGKISQFLEELRWLIRMVQAYYKKEYTAIPWKTILFALAAIIYFVNPMDVVPDSLPAIGFLDDSVVLGFVVSSIKEDLDKFKLWFKGSALNWETAESKE
ncbi:MAG: YkvA family protein [Calditrichia bacterium]